MRNLCERCRRRGIAGPDERAGLSRAARWLALPLLASLAGGACAIAATEQDPSAPRQANSEIEAYARLPVCTLSPDGQHLAVQSCRTAPARGPMPRRAVPQQIDPVPDTRLAPSLVSPRTPMAIPSAPVSAAAVAPAQATVPASLAPSAMPRALNNCSAAGCNDAQGARINSAAPGTVITPQGQVCSRNGVWIQC